jgi:hypothetical protein
MCSSLSSIQSYTSILNRATSCCSNSYITRSSLQQHINHAPNASIQCARTLHSLFQPLLSAVTRINLHTSHLTESRINYAQSIFLLSNHTAHSSNLSFLSKITLTFSHSLLTQMIVTLIMHSISVLTPIIVSLLNPATSHCINTHSLTHSSIQ